MILKEWNQALQTSLNDYRNERISASTMDFESDSILIHRNLSHNQSAPVDPVPPMSPHRQHSIYSGRNSQSTAYPPNDYNQN